MDSPSFAPASSTSAASPRFRVADVVRRFGAAFRAGRTLTREQDKALRDIAQCRTASLGGHIAVYGCGHEVTAYNSCRNRHCPRCLAGKSFEWVEQKERDLLPVPYFHVVFTLPEALLSIPPVARPALYEALFAASSSTLLSFGQKNLGGQLGFLSVLHTWGQTLTLHPHVHVVVAGGAFDVRSRRFNTSRSRFLFPVRALSSVFRGRMLALLRRRGLPEVDAATLDQVLSAAARTPWVVYAKPPFGGPAQVLRYLARYTHRVAIGDQRIVAVDDATVSFTWKDYRANHERKVMRLSGTEWLRRFSEHALPRGFTRLRSYGFLVNARKSERLPLIRELLGAQAPEPSASTTEVVQPAACRCPVCGVGLLVQRRSVVASGAPRQDSS